MDKKPRVVIIGAGFGGLFAAKTLSGHPVDVLLIDRDNYHTFTPLLYQVATSALDPSEIAHPIRSIFAGKDNIRCLMGDVTGIDPEDQSVEVEIEARRERIHYDYLIVSTGSEPNYFGTQSYQEHTFELRTLDDAVQLRNHILRLFEKAAWERDSDGVKALTSFVVIGGGPTGLETAGALYELYNHVLNEEYSGNLEATVHLVEMLPHLLDPYPQKLRQSALDQIQDLGVTVQLGAGVEEVSPRGVTLKDGTQISSQTVIWAAGVKGTSPQGLAQDPPPAPGQLEVGETLQIHQAPAAYAVGDTAYLSPENGGPYPMVIPVAKQQGILAAKNILRSIQGQDLQPFHYHDRGMMATIGRRRAVAWLYNRVPLSGYPAWLAWLGLHLVSLIGFRNQLNVLVNWLWNYLTYDRSVRIILD